MRRGECRQDINVDCAPASGAQFAIGDTTATCSATDADSNTTTTSFLVRVSDNEAPSIVSPGDQTVASIRPGFDPVVYTLPTATDNSGSVTVVCNPPSGSPLPAQTTTVICAASDPPGNVATVSFAITNAVQMIPTTGNGSLPIREALLLVMAGLILLLIARRRRNHGTPTSPSPAG